MSPGNAAADRRPAPRGRGRRLLAILVLAAMCMLVALNLEPIGMAIGPSCSLGVAGTAASATVRGWTAPTMCRALLGSAPGASRLVVQDRPAESGEPLVCELTRDGSRIRVHDQGALKVVGNGLCVVASRIPEVTPAGPGALHGVQYFLVWLVSVFGGRS